ncbi:hypothetical protein [Faecalibaculum rodentium]|uniref:hypothetical protein n=1 Tax=Faecalibaculum rodentium TaxID=1702221 RepID=UPI0025A538D0|nr:hypothetical protein [Faecalibaculum rodentium]
MTLKEFFEQNGEKPIEIQDDGTIKVLEEKGPWKPECEEKYYTIYGCGSVETFKWVDCLMDDLRKEMGNVFQTKAEANRALHRLKARKKFLDTGGHEGVERYFDLQPPTKPVWHIYPTGYGCLRTEKKSGVTAFDIWFESEDDVQKAIDSLTDDEKAALCWMGENE